MMLTWQILVLYRRCDVVFYDFANSTRSPNRAESDAFKKLEMTALALGKLEAMCACRRPSSFHYLPSQYIVFTFTSLGHCLSHNESNTKNNNLKLVIIKIEMIIKRAVFVYCVYIISLEPNY